MHQTDITVTLDKDLSTSVSISPTKSFNLSNYTSQRLEIHCPLGTQASALSNIWNQDTITCQYSNSILSQNHLRLQFFSTHRQPDTLNRISNPPIHHPLTSTPRTKVTTSVTQHCDTRTAKFSPWHENTSKTLSSSHQHTTHSNWHYHNHTHRAPH